jgi:hypothetical protein
MTRDQWVLAAAVAGIVLLSGGAIAVFSGSTLTPAQLLQLAAAAGFSGSDLITAAAIAEAESSGNPNALGDTDIGSGTGSFGLWQINADAHPEYGPNFAQLYDPSTNAAAAYAIYKTAGYSFKPWSTYNSGAYLAYLSEMQTANV